MAPSGMGLGMGFGMLAKLPSERFAGHDHFGYGKTSGRATPITWSITPRCCSLMVMMPAKNAMLVAVVPYLVPPMVFQSPPSVRKYPGLVEMSSMRPPHRAPHSSTD